MEINDIDREGFTLEKFKQMLRLFLPKYTRTLSRLKKFTDLDPKKLKQETGYDLKGIILDIDDTIAHNRHHILPENLKHIETLLSHGLKIVVYSNMIWSPRYKALSTKVPVLTNLPAKPDLNGFKAALKKLDLPKGHVAMVGDNFITDGGSIRAGIPFIKVAPLPMARFSLREFPYRLLKSFYDLLSRFFAKVL